MSYVILETYLDRILIHCLSEMQISLNDLDFVVVVPSLLLFIFSFYPHHIHNLIG